MATPTTAVDTTAPPPPPPSAEPAATAVPDQKVVHPSHPVPQPDAAPPAPASAPAPAPAPAPRKRKLEDIGFHNSDYYKIRAVIADLRVRFVQVSQAANFRYCDASREILKEIKLVMELSKKMRHNLGAISVPAKPSEKPPAVPVKDEPIKPSEKPSAGLVKDDPVKPSEVPSAGLVKDEHVKPSEQPSAGPVKDELMKPLEELSAGPVKDDPMKTSKKPSGGPVKDETAGPTPLVENNQAPQVVQTAIPPGYESVDAPTKHDSSESAAVKMEE